MRIKVEYLRGDTREFERSHARILEAAENSVDFTFCPSEKMIRASGNT